MATEVKLPALEGTRSSTAFGIAVTSDALAQVDPGAAQRAREEERWRQNYLPHMRALTTSALGSNAAAERVAAAGLASVRDRIDWGDQHPGVVSASSLRTGTIRGAARPVTALRLPVGTAEDGPQREIEGTELIDHLRRWVRLGHLEPDVVTAIKRVQANPHWLSLPGRTLVALGASSEMSPVTPLLHWGARVAALSRPNPSTWHALSRTAGASAGTLLFPTDGDPEDVADAGAQILRDLPAITAWVASLPGSLVVGNYLYGDGVMNLLLSAASDALVDQVAAAREDAALAFLGTPTDVFAVPPRTAAHSARAYQRYFGTFLSATVGRASGGRLLQPSYGPQVAGLDVVDNILAAQGPNYLLAKQMHRWRATGRRTRGGQASFLVAPVTATQSVMKSDMLARALRGARRFGLLTFPPATARVLMAALLVHDLYADQPVGASDNHAHPWQVEAAHAVHSGLWRAPFAAPTMFPVALALERFRLSS